MLTVAELSKEITKTLNLYSNQDAIIEKGIQTFIITKDPDTGKTITYIINIEVEEFNRDKNFFKV